MYMFEILFAKRVKLLWEIRAVNWSLKLEFMMSSRFPRKLNGIRIGQCCTGKKYGIPK